MILEIIKEADLNNDGEISFEEFVATINKCYKNHTIASPQTNSNV